MYFSLNNMKHLIVRAGYGIGNPIPELSEQAQSYYYIFIQS